MLIVNAVTLNFAPIHSLRLTRAAILVVHPLTRAAILVVRLPTRAAILAIPSSRVNVRLLAHIDTDEVARGVAAVDAGVC